MSVRILQVISDSFQRCVPLAALYVILGISMRMVHADDANITPSDFWSAPPEVRKEIVQDAIEQRLRVMRGNIHYIVKTDFSNYEYDEGDLKNPIADSETHTIYSCWQIDNSFRMSMRRDRKNAALNPNERIETTYDAKDGSVRSTGRIRGANRAFARIDTKPDKIVEYDRFRYWLDGKHTPTGEFIFRCIVDKFDEMSLEKGADDTTVVLVVPWQPIYKRKPVGTRSYVCDIRMGFMPISGRAEWKDGNQWRFEKFTVESPQLLENIWMPGKLQEIIGGSPLGDKTVAVYNTEVLTLEAGTVDSSDLKVTFPEGAQVVDSRQGVFYKAGRNEEPVGPVRSLIGSSAISAQMPKPVNEWFSWKNSLLAGNIALIVMFAGMVAYLKFRKKPG